MAQKLIDADALERDGWRISRIVQIDEKIMESQIKKPTDFPAVDAEPIRHGKWCTLTLTNASNEEYTMHRCSECGLTIETGWYHYCPNCGARMDKEE